MCVRKTLHIYLASKLRVRGARPSLLLYPFMACIGTALPPVNCIWRNRNERPNAFQDSRVTGEIWNRNFLFKKQDLCSPNHVIGFHWYRFNFRSKFLYFCFHDTTAPSGSGPSHFPGFTTALRHTTLGRSPLYPTTRNTRKRQTSKPLAKLGATIPASERPHIRALNRAAAGIGLISLRRISNFWIPSY